MTDDTAYSISPARYAGRWNGKPQFVIRCQSNGTGFKTRAHRLAGDGLKGRWSRREGGYVVSPTKVAKFEKLYAEGWDACVMTGALEAPRRGDS